jgi:hypothetical protein
MSEQCGDNFALPMTVAILCCRKRDRGLWSKGVRSKDLELVLKGIKGLKVPQSWKRLDKVTGHSIIPDNLNDSKQLTRLIRALIKHFKINGFPREKSAKEHHERDKGKHLG